MEQNIYKQAILDAKAIRASAIANAKTSLTEAMEPRIQEMMRLKLSEELDNDMEESYDDMEEGFEDNVGYYAGGQKPKHHASATSEDIEETEINELDLDEILAELDGISEEDDTEMVDEESLNEAESEEAKPEEEEESEEDETEDEQAEDEEMGEPTPEEDVDDETKVIDITLGDLKQVLQSVMGSQTPDVGLEPAGDEDLAADQADNDSDELSLDDVLAELEKAEGKKIDEKKTMKDDKEKSKKVEKELEEAKRVIHTLNETLKDVNLLNAKLLYVNKIFKAKSLTESEKIKVVKAFDRASNVREVKNTYVTLQESFATKKTPIRESIGFASKPAGVAPKTNIVESDPFVTRWKKIAGIK
jgi:hypothetical protein